MTAGTYYWQAIATKSTTDRVVIGSGTLLVKANLTAIVTNNYDGRSQVKTDLDAIQTAMRAMISGGAVQEYTIGTRSLKKMLMADLIVLESRLKAQYARENAADNQKNGLGNPNSLWIRFGKR